MILSIYPNKPDCLTNPLIKWTTHFFNLKGVWFNFDFFSTFDRKTYEETVKNMI